MAADRPRGRMGGALILETTFLIDLEREARRSSKGAALRAVLALAADRLYIDADDAGELAAGTSLAERGRWEAFEAPARCLESYAWESGTRFDTCRQRPQAPAISGSRQRASPTRCPSDPNSRHLARVLDSSSSARERCSGDRELSMERDALRRCTGRCNGDRWTVAPTLQDHARRGCRRRRLVASRRDRALVERLRWEVGARGSEWKGRGGQPRALQRVRCRMNAAGEISPVGGSARPVIGRTELP